MPPLLNGALNLNLNLNQTSTSSPFAFANSTSNALAQKLKATGNFAQKLKDTAYTCRAVGTVNTPKDCSGRSVPISKAIR